MKVSFVIAVVFVLLALSAACAHADEGVARWDFDVYLNDKKVGKHHFEVSRVGDVQRVRSEADFRYRILFVSAYRYEHSAQERWADDCLLGFEAKTNANGKRIEVSGERHGPAFTVHRGDGAVELPACVMTFAYWNRDFLEQPRLLNPQTGEYVKVSVEELGPETLQVRGRATPATRFRLTAYGVDLTLWYSSEEEWLALESIANGGHVIRYELS
jgi:Domain of unknown function (DUF6134)